MEAMTGKQLEVIMNLVADKFEGCKDMEEVKKPSRKLGRWRKRKRLNKSDRAANKSRPVRMWV